MSIFVPGVGNVPVVWKPSPDFTRGRAGYQPEAIVHHRAVASTMESIDSTLISSSRKVSANFAVGHRRDGALVIHQYVDLSDTAWCNGIDPTKIRSNNWTTWLGGNHHHNARSVSIEHEDQGGSSDPAKRGIVREDIVKASIALDRLMTSGDIAKIRAAGIRVRDSATVTALRRMPKDSKHLITHYDIDPVNKVYCWRPWAADKVGFPRARYVRELTSAPAPTPAPAGGTMTALATPTYGHRAVIGATANIRNAPKITGNTPVRWVPAGASETWTVIGWVKGEVDADTGSDQWLMRWSGTAYEYTAKGNVKSLTDPTPLTRAQADTMVKSATSAAEGRITTIKGKVAALAADVADD